MLIFVAVYFFIFRLQYTSVMLRLLISSVTAADTWARQTYFSLRLPGLSVRIKSWWWRFYSWCISDQGYRADGHAHQRTQRVFCLKAGLLRTGWSILMPVCSAIFIERIKHSYPERRHRTGPHLKWSTEVPDVIYNYNLCISDFYSWFLLRYFLHAKSIQVVAALKAAPARVKWNFYDMQASVA